MNFSEKLKGNILKRSPDILTTPIRVITTDTSSTAEDVSAGSVLRIRVSVATYLAFGKGSGMPTPSASTEKALELQPGTYLIAISDKFVKTSANPDRLELLD